MKDQSLNHATRAIQDWEESEARNRENNYWETDDPNLPHRYNPPEPLPQTDPEPLSDMEEAISSLTRQISYHKNRTENNFSILQIKVEKMARDIAEMKASLNQIKKEFEWRSFAIHCNDVPF